MITLLARVASGLGLPSVAMLGWMLLAVVSATAAGGVTAGIAMHSYDQAIHDKAVADLRAAAATTLAQETGKVLARLQAQIDRNAMLEDAYGRLSQDTARAQFDGARLSADLDAARQRLRDLARAGRGGGGAADGQAGPGANGCAKLQAALGRAAGALERLERGGDEAAAIGQHAVDVATIAAQAAQAATAEAGDE